MHDTWCARNTNGNYELLVNVVIHRHHTHTSYIHATCICVRACNECMAATANRNKRDERAKEKFDLGGCPSNFVFTLKQRTKPSLITVQSN